VAREQRIEGGLCTAPSHPGVDLLVLVSQAVGRAANRAGDMAPATFVPVRMAMDPDGPVIEIVLSGGERLHVRPGASVDLVRAIVTTLRSPC
jgi:hypothetical protein